MGLASCMTFFLMAHAGFLLDERPLRSCNLISCVRWWGVTETLVHCRVRANELAADIDIELRSTAPADYQPGSKNKLHYRPAIGCT